MDYDNFRIHHTDGHNAGGKNRPSKKKAIYGVFASDSDESDEESGRRSSKKKVRDVRFVSGAQTESVGEKSGRRSPRREMRSSLSFAGIDGHRQNNEIGKWQKHTSGIGSKLLSKMGWNPGQGLGKNLQGIAVPIEASVRVSGTGIGASGPELKQTAHLLSSQTEDLIHESSASSTRIPAKEKVRKNYVLKSVDELIDEEIGMGTFSESVTSSMKVLDMRGPETKILSGYHEICPSEKVADNSSSNDVEKSILSVEKQLVRNGREIRKAQQRLLALDEDKKHIDVEMRSESERLERLTDLVSILSKLKARCSDGKVTCPDLILVYSTLLRKFTAEVNQFQLHDMLSPLFLQVASCELQAWDTFCSPLRHKELFTDLQRLLLEHNADLYDTILWEIWMPLFRRQFLSHPSLKQPEDVIAFIDAWQYLLPKWLLDNILEQVVIPRLRLEVSQWDPLTDAVPVHSWIHPWLLLMEGHSLEVLYQTIREKLAHALTLWHPSDVSARIILRPWKNVMTAWSLDDFLCVHIVPKLEQVLTSFQITTGPQNYEHWNWVMGWHDLIDDRVLAELLIAHFFPKWLQVLYEWLLYSPNFEAISNWYTEWKSQIPESLALLPPVRDCLNKGLEMMDFAVSSPFGMTAYRFNASQPMGPQVAASAEQLRFMSGILTGSTQSTESMNFKQMLARKAEDSGILFMPINKLQDGKQVYALGRHKVYLDRSVVFVHNAPANCWSPAPLQSLLQQ